MPYPEDAICKHNFSPKDLLIKLLHSCLKVAIFGPYCIHKTLTLLTLLVSGAYLRRCARRLVMIRATAAVITLTKFFLKMIFSGLYLGAYLLIVDSCFYINLVTHIKLHSNYLCNIYSNSFPPHIFPHATLGIGNHRQPSR